MTTFVARRRRARASLGLLMAIGLSVPAGTALAADPTWHDESVVRVGSGDRVNSGDALGRTIDDGATILHTVATHDGGQGDADGGVYVARSTDRGAHWVKSKRLDGTTQVGDHPAVAGAGSKVFVTWRRTIPGSSRSMIYVQRNTSHGLLGAWRTRERLTSTTGRVGAPSVAASGSSVYIAYTDRATRVIWLHISRDSGATWRRTALATTTRSDGQPVVAAVGRNVGVAWVTSTGGYVKGRISTDGGRTWSAKAKIGPGTEPTATARDGRITIAAVTAAGPWVRTWVGGAWAARHALDIPTWDASRPTDRPAVAIFGTNRVGIAIGVPVVPVGPEEVEQRMTWFESADGGATWGPGQDISTGGPYNRTASVLWRASGELFILWNHRYYDDGGNVAIRARY